MGGDVGEEMVGVEGSIKSKLEIWRRVFRVQTSNLVEMLFIRETTEAERTVSLCLCKSLLHKMLSITQETGQITI